MGLVTEYRVAPISVNIEQYGYGLKMNSKPECFEKYS